MWSVMGRDLAQAWEFVVEDAQRSCDKEMRVIVGVGLGVPLWAAVAVGLIEAGHWGWTAAYVAATPVVAWMASAKHRAGREARQREA